MGRVTCTIVRKIEPIDGTNDQVLLSGRHWSSPRIAAARRPAGKPGSVASVLGTSEAHNLGTRGSIPRLATRPLGRLSVEQAEGNREKRQRRIR